MGCVLVSLPAPERKLRGAVLVHAQWSVSPA
jgi:hypothetical protein